MAKKGMFSWLKFGQKEQEADTQVVEEVRDSETSEDMPVADQIRDTEQQGGDTDVVETPVTDDVAVADDSVEDNAVELAAPAAGEVVAEVADDAVEQVDEQPAEAADEQPAEAADEQAVEEVDEPAIAEVDEASVAEPQEKPKKAGFFTRLKQGLQRTKAHLGSGFFGLFRGKKIDDELFEELEEQLLIADVGVDTTLKVINSLTEHADRKQLKDGEALYQLLQEELAEVIKPVDQPLVIDDSKTPYVILMVGVNGVGKTTTIGKLAKQFQAQGKTVALAAGDTFRAAAVEQLQVWGQRNDIQVIAQHTGADSASVIYDAVEAAKARGVDVLIADTAGRLQNKAHLMEELKKILRVMRKLDDTAPHEVMLTLDAGTGQNAISQLQLFHDAVGVTGITLTKLDGTAKGGVLFALADKFGIPIRYIGVGEGIDDLRTFDSKEFIEALFANDE